MSGWQPVASFFTVETDGPCVRLLTDAGEATGYWDDDERCWYREREGPDLESEPVQPTHWKPLASAWAQAFVDNLNRQTRDK